MLTGGHVCLTPTIEKLLKRAAVAAVAAAAGAASQQIEGSGPLSGCRLSALALLARSEVTLLSLR